MKKEDKKLSKSEKQLSKTWAKMKVKENKNFTKYFSGLYNSLSQRFNQELSLHTDFKDKIDFIQSLINEIIEALHDAKNNFQITELAERQITPLISLRNVLEKELNDIYLNPKSTNANTNGQNIKHSDYNPNHFSSNGFELFKYLVENYALGKSHGTATRFMNIWHFFNSNLYNDPIYKKQRFLTTEEYKAFIKKSYDVKIKNVDKKHAYENTHLPMLSDHFSKFKEIKKEIN